MDIRKWALGALLFTGAYSTAQAQIKICVFDLLGKAGESYKMLEEWSLAAKAWQADVELISYQNEPQAEQDFQQGKCDGAYMTSMRARDYNKFAGSVDAIGAVPNNAIAQKAIRYALDRRNARRLISNMNGKTYEIAGISQIGLAYIFVKDKKINKIEHIKGKKFAVLGYDEAQRIVVKSLGGQAVISEINDIAKKFNSGIVDATAAPAYAYKPLEIYKGLASQGGIVDFPAVNLTADLIIYPEKFPKNFSQQSRDWFLKQIPRSFAMVERLEEEIPRRYFIQVSPEERKRYQSILRDARIQLTKQGIYDSTMMTVLKRARCTIDRTNFECTLGGE